MTLTIGILIAIIIASGIVIMPNFASSQNPATISGQETTASGSTISTTNVKLLKSTGNSASTTKPVQLNLRGKIISEGNIKISATTPATVKEILVHRGQTVKKGDPLITLGGSKDGKHALEIAYEQTLLSKQNIETNLQNTTTSTNIAIRQAEQQRNTLAASGTQLQKSLDLTRNAGNYAVQGANLALNNLQNTITRTQGIRDLSGNLADSTLDQAQELAQLSIQNTARSLLVSLQGTVIPLLEGIKNTSTNTTIRNDWSDIKDIIDNLDEFKDVSDNHIPSDINDITGILYDLMDSIENISIDVTKVDTAAAKPLVDAWKQLSSTINSSVAVSITQLSTTRNQIQNGPTNKDIQLSTPDNQIRASQDQQQVLEMAIAQAQNAAALQEQGINSQLQSIEQQKISTSLAIEAAKAAAKAQKDNLEGQLNIATKQLEQAQIQLSQLSILASMDGYVVDVPVNVNEDVTVGRELLTIYGSQPQFIRLSINPSDREQIKVGDNLMISLNNDTTEIPATIDKIAVVSDATGTIPVDCSFNSEQTLPIGFVPGSNVQARTSMIKATNSTSSEPNHFVPVSAIVIDNGQTFVWLYKQGKISKQIVKIGPSQNDQVSILDQLDWTNVVTNPTADLQEGQSVTISN